MSHLYIHVRFCESNRTFIASKDEQRSTCGSEDRGPWSDLIFLFFKANACCSLSLAVRGHSTICCVHTENVYTRNLFFYTTDE